MASPRNTWKLAALGFSLHHEAPCRVAPRIWIIGKLSSTIESDGRIPWWVGHRQVILCRILWFHSTPRRKPSRIARRSDGNGLWKRWRSRGRKKSKTMLKFSRGTSELVHQQSNEAVMTLTENKSCMSNTCAIKNLNLSGCWSFMRASDMKSLNFGFF